MIDTKQRILDTAERLFGERGYDAVSLRHIIGEAGVNLAAVHYHFGSKEDLLAEVVVRKIGPVNDARLAALAKAEAAAAGAPVPVEAILRAFLMPTAAVAGKSPQFVKLMGRLVGEGHIERIAEQRFRPMLERFIAALSRTLPSLSREDLGWRIHFMFGAVSRALCGEAQLWLTGADIPLRDRIEKLVAFLAGALLAAPAQPAPPEPEPIEVTQ